MILPCSCKHPVQDEMYGAGRRVMNLLKTKGARCTVCGKVNDSVQPKEEKKDVKQS